MVIIVAALPRLLSLQISDLPLPLPNLADMCFVRRALRPEIHGFSHAVLYIFSDLKHFLSKVGAW